MAIRLDSKAPSAHPPLPQQQEQQQGQTTQKQPQLSTQPQSGSSSSTASTIHAALSLLTTHPAGTASHPGQPLEHDHALNSPSAGSHPQHSPSSSSSPVISPSRASSQESPFLAEALIGIEGALQDAHAAFLRNSRALRTSGGHSRCGNEWGE